MTKRDYQALAVRLRHITARECRYLAAAIHAWSDEFDRKYDTKKKRKKLLRLLEAYTSKNREIIQPTRGPYDQ